jgi:hypothetical protein
MHRKQKNRDDDELRSGSSECWGNLAGEESSNGRKLQFNSHWVATGPCQRREQVCQVSSRGLSCKKKISVQSPANLQTNPASSAHCRAKDLSSVWTF